MLATQGKRHPLVEQIQRAALSVQLNVAEGYDLKSSKRFRNHLDIAYASAVETSDLLDLCRQMEILPQEVAGQALGRCQRSQQLIRGLINRLRRQ